MSANRENLMNPGIFVRIFNEKVFEVAWMDGFEVIEMAYQEEEITENTIDVFLKSVGHFDYNQDIYDEWGVHQSTVSLRNITLREAGAYLGRKAKICVFLRPKEQAIRFIRFLEENGGKEERKITVAISDILEQFDIHARKMFDQRAAEMIELDRENNLL